MSFFETLKQTLGRDPTRYEVVRDLADRISAMEQQQRYARQDGDTDLLENATNQIEILRNEARVYEFDPNEFPGLFR